MKVHELKTKSPLRYEALCAWNEHCNGFWVQVHDIELLVYNASLRELARIASEEADHSLAEYYEEQKKSECLVYVHNVTLEKLMELLSPYVDLEYFKRDIVPELTLESNL